MSHTLWAAWLCWTTGFAVDALLHLKYSRRNALAGAVPKLNES
jgi:membrane-associated PAP2 superfamily phosphatase